jgi:biotin operon repressor
MSGWIKLHRKITEWQWYNKSEYVHFFIHVLASANHKDCMWQGIEIKKGSLITSLDKLRVATGISAQSLRTIIKKLQNTGEIDVKSTSQWTMITVCKYDSYQLSDEDANKPTNKPSTKKQQTANKPLTTNKNDNNDKEEKEVYRAFDHLEIEQHEIDKLIGFGYSIEKIDNILDRIQNFAQNKKYKSLYLTALNWLKSDADKPTGIDKQRLQVAEGMPEHRKGLVI